MTYGTTNGGDDDDDDDDDDDAQPDRHSSVSTLLLLMMMTLSYAKVSSHSFSVSIPLAATLDTRMFKSMSPSTLSTNR